MIMQDSDVLTSLFGSTKSSILEYLCRSESSMDDLSHMLGVNKNAVKEHMEYLESRGYVRSYFRNEGVGRPRKYYELTEKGFELFPRKYSLFAGLLIDVLQEELGSDRVDEILNRVAIRILRKTSYDNSTDASLGREEKIRRLEDFVSALNELGYYARLEVSGDTVRIIRSNCVFYELAKNNSVKICGSLDSDIIRNSTGKDFNIVERFTDGSRKCVVELKL